MIDHPTDLTRVLVARSAVLAELEDAESITAGDLGRSLDIARSTAHRVLSELLDHGIIERTDGCYRLTPFGRYLHDRVESTMDEIGLAAELRPFLTAGTSLPVPFDPTDFADATITWATTRDPYAPTSRFLDLFDETTSVLVLHVDSATPPEVWDRYLERLDDGLSSTSIWSEAAIEGLIEHHGPLDAQPETFHRQTIYVTEDIPMKIDIHDSRVVLVHFDDRTGVPAVLVDTSAAEARTWAETVFDAYLDRSVPLDEYR